MVKYAWDQLRKSEVEWTVLNRKAEGLRQDLRRPFNEKEDKKRTRLRRELGKIETEIETRHTSPMNKPALVVNATVSLGIQCKELQIISFTDRVSFSVC
jgi:hypothetical protein